MKNFLELLATEQFLDIEINGKTSSAGIRAELEFNINDTVVVDGYEILPRYKHLADGNILKINEPFYCWYHRASGQGWLLNPY